MRPYKKILGHDKAAGMEKASKNLILPIIMYRKFKMVLKIKHNRMYHARLVACGIEKHPRKLLAIHK